MVKALQIYEIMFQRDIDPKMSMGTGLSGYEIPWKKRKEHIFKHKNKQGYINKTASRGYLIYQLLKFIDSNEKTGGTRYKDIVKKYDSIKSVIYNTPVAGARTLAMGVWNSIKKQGYTRKEILEPKKKMEYRGSTAKSIGHTGVSVPRKTRYYLTDKGKRFLEKYAPYFEK